MSCVNELQCHIIDRQNSAVTDPKAGSCHSNNVIWHFKVWKRAVCASGARGGRAEQRDGGDALGRGGWVGRRPPAPAPRTAAPATAPPPLPPSPTHAAKVVSQLWRLGRVDPEQIPVSRWPLQSDRAPPPRACGTCPSGARTVKATVPRTVGHSGHQSLKATRFSGPGIKRSPGDAWLNH